MRFLIPLVVALTAWASTASAQSLVMIEQPGCVHCLRWHEEIGTAYPKTEIGQQLGLERVQLSEVKDQPFTPLRPVSFTPTFLLIIEGSEAGRLEGYAGAHFFWPLLEGMVDKARAAKDG